MTLSKLALNLRYWVGSFLAIAILSFATDLFAQSAVLVPPFGGSKPQGLHDLAVRLLEDDGFTVAEGGDSLTDDAPESDVARVAGNRRAIAVVFGKTALTKVYWRSTFKVHDGSTGKKVGEATVQGKSFNGLQKAYKEKLISELMPLFEQCSSGDSPAPATAKPPAGSTADDSFFADKTTSEPPAAAEEPAASTDSDTDGDTNSDSDGESAALDLGPDEREQRRDSLKKTEAFAVTLGPSFALRNWSVNDPLRDAQDGALLPAHDVPAMGFRAGLLVFPAAFFSEGAARHLGLQVHYAMSLLGQTSVENVTRDPNDTSRDTTLQSFDVGLHVRLPFDALTLGIIGAYGFDATLIDGPKTAVAVPDVQTDFVRAGLLTQIAFGKTTSGRLELGYRHVLGFGDEPPQLQAAGWFPHALGHGFDGRLELRQMFSNVFGLALGGELAQYTIDFDVQPDDVANASNASATAPPLAGGATDRYLRFDLSAVVSLGK